MSRALRHAPTWLPLLAFLLFGGIACDFDFTAVSDTASADEPSGASDERAAVARAEGYQSIGDDGSMRVYYQYIDASSGVRFVERLEDVPPEWRDRVGFVEMDSPPPMRPEDARRTWRADPNDISVARATPARSDEIVLYYADWCGYCKLARRHLDREGVDYDLRDVDIPAIGLELMEKTGRKSIPVLDVDGRILRGYSRQQYQAILENA